MEENEYDIIIAGAGPAGAQCARHLSENSDYSILLLDKTQEIGQPKKSTAGTVMETMEKFNLPKKLIMQKIHSVILESPSHEIEVSVPGCVLEFGELKKFLVREAVHNGVKVEISATVNKPLLKKGEIAGIEYQCFEGINTAKARIIIDATGPRAVLATLLGLRKLNPKNHWIGMEFEMENLNLKHNNSMLIKLDNNYAPGGYSWIFSTGKNYAKVGNCWNNEFFKKKGGRGSQLSYLKKWIKSDERLKNGVPLEMHAGDAYFDSSIRKKSTSNFMAIGDTICSINPLFGEGIRPGMYSAIFAAETAIEALKKNDTSAKQLSNYDMRWQQNIGENRRFMHYISNRLYNFSNTKYEKLTRNFRKLDKVTINRIINYKFTLNDIRKIFPI